MKNVTAWPLNEKGSGGSRKPRHASHRFVERVVPRSLRFASAEVGYGLFSGNEHLCHQGGSWTAPRDGQGRARLIKVLWA